MGGDIRNNGNALSCWEHTFNVLRASLKDWSLNVWNDVDSGLHGERATETTQARLYRLIRLQSRPSMWQYLSLVAYDQTTSLFTAFVNSCTRVSYDLLRREPTEEIMLARSDFAGRAVNQRQIVPKIYTEHPSTATC